MEPSQLGSIYTNQHESARFAEQAAPNLQGRAQIQPAFLQGRETKICLDGSQYIRMDCRYSHPDLPEIDPKPLSDHAILQLSSSSPAFIPQPFPIFHPPVPAPQPTDRFTDEKMNRWSHFFEKRLSSKDFYAICREYNIINLDTSKPLGYSLLEALVSENHVSLQTDERDLAQIFRRIDRDDLVNLFDGSSSLKDFYEHIKRLAGRTLFLVDGDNLPGVPHLVKDLLTPSLPPCVDPRFLVVCFVSKAAGFKFLQETRSMPPWFITIRTQTMAKDAADHLITLAAGYANDHADLETKIRIVSGDGFAPGAVSLLKELQPKRDIKVISDLQGASQELNRTSFQIGSIHAYQQESKPAAAQKTTECSGSQCTRLDCWDSHTNGQVRDSWPFIPDIVEKMLDKWSHFFETRLSPKDISAICHKYNIINLDTSKPLGNSLLEALVKKLRLNLRDDLRDLAQIFAGIGRGDLANLVYGWYSLKDLYERIKRLAGRTLFLVDEENSSIAARIGLELFPPRQTSSLDPHFVVVFLRNRGAFNVAPTAFGYPWFISILAPTETNEAVNHLITLAAGYANDHAYLEAKIRIVSHGRFAFETASSLKVLQPNRDIEVINLDGYRNLLQTMCPVPQNTSQTVFHSPSLLQPDIEIKQLKPMSVQSIPNVSISKDGEEKKEGGLEVTENQFNRFVELIDKNYVQMGLGLVRMSKLGHLMKVNLVYNEKNGLSRLIKRAKELGLLERQGEAELAEVVLSHKDIKKWVKEHPYTIQTVFQSPSLLQPDVEIKQLKPMSVQSIPKVSISKDDEEKKEGGLEGTEKQFIRFVELIDKNYVQMGLGLVRMSKLGHLMRNNFVYNEKGGLSRFIKRAEELGLLKRQGEHGQLEVVFSYEDIKEWMKEHLYDKSPSFNEESGPYR